MITKGKGKLVRMFEYSKTNPKLIELKFEDKRIINKEKPVLELIVKQITIWKRNLEQFGLSHLVEENFSDCYDALQKYLNLCNKFYHKFLNIYTFNDLQKEYKKVDRRAFLKWGAKKAGQVAAASIASNVVVQAASGIMNKAEAGEKIDKNIETIMGWYKSHKDYLSDGQKNLGVTQSESSEMFFDAIGRMTIATALCNNPSKVQTIYGNLYRKYKDSHSYASTYFNRLIAQLTHAAIVSSENKVKKWYEDISTFLVSEGLQRGNIAHFDLAGKMVRATAINGNVEQIKKATSYFRNMLTNIDKTRRAFYNLVGDMVHAFCFNNKGSEICNAKVHFTSMLRNLDTTRNSFFHLIGKLIIAYSISNDGEMTLKAYSYFKSMLRNYNSTSDSFFKLIGKMVLCFSINKQGIKNIDNFSYFKSKLLENGLPISSIYFLPLCGNLCIASVLSPRKGTKL